MKRWVLIMLGFVGLLLWNIITQWSIHPNAGFGYRTLEAVGRMTSPIQLFLLAVVVLAAWKRKPLSER